MIYAFGAYTLDTDRYELRQAGQPCALEPHAIDILTYLLEHRARVVTKRELLERLWPDRFVGEGILAQRLMMIRKAIGDSGRSQHCIKTLHGRGYRFAAEVAVHANAPGGSGSAAAAGPRNPAAPVDAQAAKVPAPSVAALSVESSHHGSIERRAEQAIASRGPPALFSRPPFFVGRDTQLAELARWWSKAQQGVRQVGFIVGEAGIGKTALVDAFVAQLAAAENVWVGRGQCMDHYGTGEPYLPVLEALGRLCRDAGGEQIESCLRRHAPSWLVHLPALTTANGDALARTTHGVTPARMLRELTDALEVLTASRPLVLVLEDLHWSDRATLAWLAYLARRRDPAHVLILGTYRPDGVIGPLHPLRALLAALQPQAECSELVLNALSAPAVAAYLGERYAAAMLPASLPRLIHQRTSGHPLFLVTMVDELVRQKRLEAAGEAALSEEDLASLSEFVPSNLRQYIERQLDRLSAEDQALLAAASTAGSAFAVAAVAAGVAQTPATVGPQYAALARQGQFIQAGGTETWPDGTITACYQFKHALYHEVVYARASAAQRVRLHRQIGDRKERGYGAQAQQIAAELAVHFARGGDARRAVHYLHGAAQNALRRSAYQEATTHLTQGLDMLPSLSETSERTQHELEFLTTLGLALVATKGQAHAEVERTYTRARTLCHRLGASAQLFQALWGLFSFHVVRAQLPAAWDVSQQLLALAERGSDTSLRMVAHFALGQTSLFQGKLVAARMHLEQGIALYDPQEHHGLSARAGFPGDLGVFCRCFAAHTLWHLGYPDQALQHSLQALALAQELAHPYSRALALAYAAMLYQFRREEHRVYEAAEATVAVCREQGFPYYLAWGTIMQGWALTAMGQAEGGMAQMHLGMASMRATGAALRRPYYLALLAQACGQTGQAEPGLAMLAEGLSEVRQNGECWRTAELHRVQGELLLLRGAPTPALCADSSLRRPASEAAQCFRRALGTAHRQQARSLELRVAMSFARVWRDRGKRGAAYDLLASIYGRFTEGFETADLQDAKTILDELE